MNRCLRCNEPRSEASLFCERCQSSLLNRSQEKGKGFEAVSLLEQRPPHMQDPQQGNAQIHAAVVEQETVPVNPHTQLSSTVAVTTPHPRQRTRLKRLRIGFIVLTMLAILALIVDVVLVLLVLAQTRHPDRTLEGRAIAALAVNTASRGQKVVLHLSHFTPSAEVLITHDIQEPVQMGKSASAFVEIGTAGRADVSILIGENWSAGPHILQAEDSKTHAIASTTVEVVGAGPIVSPQLKVSTTSLNLGTTNSWQEMQLQNAGSGIVTWRVSSRQPWLKITPTQGAFSSSQTVVISVSRSDLKPEEYQGMLTFVSDQGSVRKVSVRMEVLPGQHVLAVAETALELTAYDGEADRASQLFKVSNHSTQPVRFAVTAGTARQDIAAFSALNWLEMDSTALEIAPMATESIHVHVHSNALLAGKYSGLITLKSDQKEVPALTIAVSLSVRPPCGAITTIGSISYAVVAQPGRTSSQKVELRALPGCTGAMNWQAFSSANWLTATPDTNQMQEKGSAMTTVSVNGSSLQPGTYNGSVIFIAQRYTHTLSVQLAALPIVPSPPQIPVGTTRGGGGSSPTVQSTGQATPGSGSFSTPAPTSTPIAIDKPGLNVVTTTLTFSVAQGGASSRVVMLANTGGGEIRWWVSSNASLPPWLNVAPASGVIAASQSEQMRVGVDASGIAPGMYSATLVVMATDSNGIAVQGSPQEVVVSLNVLSPCTLQVTPQTLTFTTSFLQPQPSAQSITIKAAGNCAYPISWKATVDAGSRSWLTLSAQSGSESSYGSPGSTEIVSVNGKGLLPGTYSGRITIAAYASDGSVIMSSPQTVVVTLNSNV